MKKQQYANIEEPFTRFFMPITPTPSEPAIPKGFIGLWSGLANNIPNGWALCDGMNGTPDLRGRFVVGGIAGSAWYSIGNRAGVTDVTLQPFNLPSHTHSGSVSVNGNTNTTGDHNHNVWYPTGGQPTNTWTNGINNGGGFNRYKTGSTDWIENNGSHSHTVTASGNFKTNDGDQPTKNQPINILPPYYALAYIMKL